ncbi:MAG: FMN-binding protein [Eggerthella sp.]|nr:FMN-binding protein [Eggerthella sp.]
MTKPEQGKHARAKERLKAATLLTPAALTGVAIALSVGAYQPLEYDPSSIAHVAQAQAQELKTAEATSEKQSAENPSIESNFGMDIGTLNDGTYQGSARGYKSVITVSVTVQGGKIVSITIVSAGDDEPYFGNAKAVIDRVIGSQSMNVDTVSGATYSSTGILVAIKNALLQAAGKAPVENAVVPAQQQTHKPASNTAMPAGSMKDGVYTGSGMGYNDNITVRVTVQNGAIANIEILDADDDEPYFTNAQAVIARMLSKQTTQVDVVTGATYSSKGIMAAVSDALRKAVAANAGSGAEGGSGSGGNNGGGGSAGGGSGSDPNPDP